MPPTLSTDEKFKFLISCIRWSNNGKIDYARVAEDNKLPSKGAAYIKYRRIMQAHGLVVSKSGSGSPKTKVEAKAAPEFKNDSYEDDVKVEDSSSVSARTTIKQEDDHDAIPRTPVKRERVEDGLDEITPRTRTTPRKRLRRPVYTDEWALEGEDSEWDPSYL